MGWAKRDVRGRGGWLRGGGDWIKLNALLYDTFKTADAAPITSPRTCEPGPGVVTVVDDAGEICYIADGSFVLNQKISEPGLLYFWKTSPTLDFVAGTAAYSEQIMLGAAEWVQFGIGSNAGATNTPRTYHNNYYQSSGTQINGLYPPFVQNVPQKILIVMRSYGSYLVANGKLCWVEDTADFGGSDLSIIARSGYSGAAWSVAFPDVAALPLATYNSAWGGDWTEVTDSLSAPGYGDAVDIETDYSWHMTFTYEAGKFILLNTRYNTSANRVGVEIATDGKLLVYEYVASAFKSLLATAVVFSDGVEYTMDATHEGNTLKVFVDGVLKGTFTTNAALTAAAGLINDTLVTNDIVLTTHPYPALGIATSRVVCPQAQTAFTHTDDFVFEVKSIQLDIEDRDTIFRMADANNNIFIRFYSDGKIYLYQRVAGSASAKITGDAGTVSDDDDVVLTVEGANAQIFVNGTSIGSTSALTTITTGTSGIWSNAATKAANADHIACFPRDVSGILPKGTF